MVPAALLLGRLPIAGYQAPFKAGERIMKLNRTTLSDAVRYGLLAGLAGVVAAPAAFAQEGEEAKTLDRIEVTGSRLKRADIEGAVPVIVIDRASIDATGDVSVADVLRDSTFASFGNFKPQSGSSAQSLASVDLRGLGPGRTLVLIDGRRAPTNPMSASDGADMNAIPLAAVERIELRPDGASPVDGSDANRGVDNLILRNDLHGLGSGRSLLLIDGRRAPTNPMSASDGADMNAIPLAAVERIEILSDGASAVYGSDAIGGVVNIILRKDFNGAELRYGYGQTKVEGGDLEDASAVFGVSNDRGRLIGGASKSSRGMVYTRDQIGGNELGVSTYGNNYYDWDTGAPAPVPGFACNSNGFWSLPANN